MSKVISINRTPGDYIRDTRHLSLEERGAYQDILDQIVQLGQDEDPPSLPDDDRTIANLLGCTMPRWRQIKPRLCAGPLAVLICSGGRISQTRIVTEIEEARKRIEAGHKGGKASGESRRHKRDVLRERMMNSGSNGRSTVVQRSPQNRSSALERDDRTDLEPVTSHESLKEKNPLSDSRGEPDETLPVDVDEALRLFNALAAKWGKPLLTEKRARRMARALRSMTAAMAKTYPEFTVAELLRRVEQQSAFFSFRWKAWDLDWFLATSKGEHVNARKTWALAYDQAGPKGPAPSGSLFVAVNPFEENR